MSMMNNPGFIPYNNPQINMNKDNGICVEICNKLCAMFPNLKRDYIKKFCPSHWTGDKIERYMQFSTIVDGILNDKASWDCNNEVDRVDFIDVDGDVPNVEDIFEYLVGIFPNADPCYLYDNAITFGDNNSVKTFVDRQLKSPDYPTRDNYLVKLRITEEQKFYTTNFIVADFIKIIPNPFDYFEDRNRMCRFELICLEFLKTFYSRIRVNTIKKIYIEYNYNMSLTAKYLKSCNDDMKTRRVSSEISTDKIEILQEMAFIRYRDDIRKYIDEIELNERHEIELLKKQNKILVCQCCYDNECTPSKCSQCQSGHNFCNLCIIKGTDTKLSDGETHIPCFISCGSEFSLSTLQNILLPTKFNILLKKRQTEEIMAAGLKGLVSCPFCNFASIPPDGEKIFKCLNPECMKESCINCKELNHLPLHCHEAMNSDKARKYVEEKMTQALARNCYKCNRSFFKDEGCNKITCPCGATMCYLCEKPVKDYSHFVGQGSTSDKSKCPLWTDNRRVNAEVVIKVAQNACNELLRKDPTLKINTDGLIPKLPPPTLGPHNEIFCAENIAMKVAARVMGQNPR